MNKKLILLDISFYTLLIFLSVYLYSCGGADPTKKCTDKNLDENCCPKSDTSLKALPKANISTINVFVETSGSMKGYMPADTPATDFQTIIPEILSNLSSTQRVNFYSIHSSNASFRNLDLTTARKSIQKGLFDWNGSTYLPEMLDSIFKGYLKDNEVNIFISDCIYSPEAKDAKDLNLTPTDIRDKMKLYSDSFSTTMFCLFSEFRKANKSGSIKSPYYLILQGKPQNINAVENLLSKSFKAYPQEVSEVNFGMKYPKPFYTILPYSETSGNFIPATCESFENAYLSIQDISMESGNDSLQFWLGLDLKSLPNYAKEMEYLDSSLNFTIDNGSVKIMSIIDKIPASIVNDDKKIASRCSHFIQVKITRLDELVSTLSFSLKYLRPKWIRVMNEPQNENNRAKTYKLEELISGFEQAYNQNNDGYFFKDFSIALIKK